MDKYDIAIIGAGIAGSTLAILFAQDGKKVLLIEKNKLPHHKVCGEFISLESYPFFISLGLELDKWNLPIIKKLRLTSQKGTTLISDMQVGGFGISRHKLDKALVSLAQKSGATVLDNTKVIQATKDSITTNKQTFQAKTVIGGFGKYKPNFFTKNSSQLKNYVGVKYHIKGNFDPTEIALHSFEGGYCGISQIEDQKFCLCYLVDAELLKRNSSDFKKLELNILAKNKDLKHIFETAAFLWDKPKIISNIQFDKQIISENGILFCGDAAGSISPLSGNGMSIAARSALLLYQIYNSTDKNRLMATYETEWERSFAGKISRAKLLNQIMLNPIRHDVILRILKAIGPLRTTVINDMQGKPFVRTTKLTR